MKKIAILTMIGRYNYGNRLQNYSLQNFLEKNFEAEVRTIYYPLITLNRYEDKKTIRKLIGFLTQYKSLKDKKRYFKFKKFDELIHFDTNLSTMNEIDMLNNSYDYFVVGSDQVWNSKYWFRSFLLPNIDKKKKISYSASIARCEIDDEEKYFFKKYLDSFRGVSVRERFSKETLRELTQNEISCNVDPTFLTSADEWKKLAKRPKGLGKESYIFTCFLSGTNNEYETIINKIAEENNLKIINIFDKKSKFSTLSPNEFLYMIQNAKLTITDSFHAIVFSIIFKTPFIHLQTLSSDGYGDMSLRLKNLEELFNTKFIDLSNIKDSVNDDLFVFKIKDSEDIIKQETKKAVEYFNQVFSKDKDKNNLDDKDFFCSGCGLCKNICPVGAIDYIVDDEGFIQKKIDENKCIHCGLCVKNCPMLKSFKKLKKDNLFVLNRKTELRDNSSTTGLFSKLAEKILENDGCVFGAKYDKNDNTYFKVENKNDLDKIKGSKYYQFDYQGIYKEIDKELKNNRQVLVCGTPCQIAGISQKFGKNKNLYLVQLICHGVPSKKLFNEICKEIFSEIPQGVNFKYHYPTWDNYSVKYKFKNNEKIINHREDIFMRYFLDDIALNNCCYNCRFAGNETGADIIIGDCWLITSIDKKMYDKNGVSIVKINSRKAMNLFELCTENFNVKRLSKSKIKYSNFNLFDSFLREKEFFDKARFVYKLENEKNFSYKDYLNKNQENVVVQSKTKSIKNFIKKVIKKLIRY